VRFVTAGQLGRQVFNVWALDWKIRQRCAAVLEISQLAPKHLLTPARMPLAPICKKTAMQLMRRKRKRFGAAKRFVDL
jgi:hypothetical protein